jgi:hypothetical protein
MASLCEGLLEASAAGDYATAKIAFEAIGALLEKPPGASVTSLDDVRNKRE